MSGAAQPDAGALAPPANVRQTWLSNLLAALAAVSILLLFASPLAGVAFAMAAVIAGSFLLFDPLLYLAIFLLPLAPMVELEGFPIHDWASFGRLLIFAGVFARRLVDREPVGPWLWKGRFQKWMLLYVAVTTISATVVNPLEGSAVRSLLRLASYVLFYYAVTGWVRSPEQLRKIVMALLVSTITVCLLAFFQVASGSFGDWFYRLYSNQRDVIPPWTGRVSSVFLGVNFLAGYLIMALPLALACQTWTQDLLLRRAAELCFFLGVITLVLTQSRGAYIAFLAILWIAFKTVVRSRRARLKFLPGFALALIIGGAISYWATQAVNDTGTTGPTAAQRFTSLDETTLERLQIYAAAWRMFLDSPVMGIGYGNFRAHFSPMTGDGVSDVWDAHNLYLKILAETGAVGFICFFAMVGSIMLLARKNWKEPSHNTARILAVAVLGGVITVLAQGLVESLTDLPQFGSLLWLLFALLIVANRVESSVVRAFRVSTPTSLA